MYRKLTKTDEITLIVCVNFLESKIYMYLENGVIVKRYNFSDYKTKFGEIVTTSANGLNFLMK